MECFRHLLDHIAWIAHQFLSDIIDSRKAGRLWGMMRVVGGVRKSIHQNWLAKGLGFGLGLLYWCFKGVQEEIPSEKASTLQIRRWHFQQDNAPVHNSLLVTDYLTKMGINTVPHSPYSPDLVPCDIWLFSKLRGCRYETIEEMREAVTKGVDMLTQENFHRTVQVYCSRRRLLRRGLEFHVCTINKSAHTKKKSGNLFNDWRIYIYILYIITDTFLSVFF